MTLPDPKEEASPPEPWRPIAAERPPRQRAQALVAWLVLVLAAVIAAVGTSPYWAPGVAPLLPWGERAPVPKSDENAAAIRDLQTRLDADEATLKRQAVELGRLGTVAETVKDQAARLARLETRPVQAPPGPAPSPAAAAPSAEEAAAIKALKEQIASLTAGHAAAAERLAKLQGEIGKATAGARADRALLMALADLRAAAEGGGPFAAELATAQAVTGDKAAVKTALAALAADAKSGLPTTAALAARFDRQVAPAILRARHADSNAGWWQQVRSRMERLVVIRRIGPGGSAPRDADEAAVDKADAALRAGSLEDAVRALDTLSGDAAKAAAPWLSDAKRRLGAEAILARLWREEIEKPGDRS